MAIRSGRSGPSPSQVAGDGGVDVVEVRVGIEPQQPAIRMTPQRGAHRRADDGVVAADHERQTGRPRRERAFAEVSRQLSEILPRLGRPARIVVEAHHTRAGRHMVGQADRQQVRQGPLHTALLLAAGKARSHDLEGSRHRAAPESSVRRVAGARTQRGWDEHLMNASGPGRSRLERVLAVYEAEIVGDGQ
jgi:hypothetical protein